MIQLFTDYLGLIELTPATELVVVVVCCILVFFGILSMINLFIGFVHKLFGIT